MSEPGVDELVVSLAVCPACRERLGWSATSATCVGCRRRYPVRDGVAVLLATDSTDPRRRGAEGSGHNADQARHFDEEVDHEWEIARPRGAPELHRWMLAEKFRRAVAGLDWLPGSTALVVCGGSGMDAEFLEAAGVRVVTSDVSLGAALRARQRARRHGRRFASIVADVERLPFANESCDLVYVHDGLHHLQRQHRAIDEMARVARRGVSVSEPARATVTALGVRLGAAMEWEEPGNRIARLRVQDITLPLASAGYSITRAERYALYYRHVPGRVTELLSRPPVVRFVKGVWGVLNALIGRYGNKLVVVAEREAARRGAISDRPGEARPGWS